MVVFALAIQRFPLTRYTFTHGAAKDDNAGYVTTENERLWILNLNRFYLLFVYYIPGKVLDPGLHCSPLALMTSTSRFPLWSLMLS